MLEARAITRYIGSSPRKMRLVIDLVRGKSVDEALTILHFSPNHASKAAEKVIRSAVSNLHNKGEGSRLETNEMYIKEVFVDEGPSMKRVLPAPMGRAYRILKRSNHVTVIISQKAEKVKHAPSAKSKEAGQEQKQVKEQKQLKEPKPHKEPKQPKAPKLPKELKNQQKEQ
jgi:large subunit ribosomal protein L22